MTSRGQGRPSENPAVVSRRTFLKGTGALIVSFSFLDLVRPLAVAAQPSTQVATIPPEQLDSWLAVASDGRVTVYVGKVDLGTGVKTALAQIAAEELDVSLADVTMVQGDTATTVNQGETFGSQSISMGGTQLRSAAAEARSVLIQQAAQRLGVSPDNLTVRGGVISLSADPSRSVTYAELVGGRQVEVQLSGQATPKDPSEYQIVGKAIPRLDIPEKVTGLFQYVQNVRLPGMLHGRMVRPAPQSGATLVSLDESSLIGIPGLVHVFVRDNMVGVVTRREEQAIKAARQLQVTWSGPAGLPDQSETYAWVRNAPADDQVLEEAGDAEAGLAEADRRIRATYEFPFQSHGMIGPVTSVVDVKDSGATVWSGTQNPVGLRAEIARALDLPTEAVRVIYIEGSGCYGRYTADDAALEAALLSQVVGQPVRVQWSRQEEHGWDHYNPAMVFELEGGLDEQGNVTAWSYDVWSASHLGDQLLGSHTGGRWANPRFVGINSPNSYNFDHRRLTLHALRSQFLRSGSFRSLGSIESHFAAESFFDELAAAAAADPVEMRLRYAAEPRGRAVLQAAAELAGWSTRPSPKPDAARRGVATGRGVALGRYGRTRVAAVAEIVVDTTSGELSVTRVSVAHDCGLMVNPDGVRNQVEGNVIQAVSRTLKEEVRFDRAAVTSVDWVTYPILTFPEVPEVQINLINRPDVPSSGAGEAATTPIPAAIGNAIFDATGIRLRRVPFTSERVLAALNS
jgi:nicotinate dehydrogenase subunit B